jgi:ABC-type transport system substrate-binding protein
VNELITSGQAATGEQARQLQIELEHRQGDLDAAHNELAKASDAVEVAMEAARQALYSIDARAEPTLGSWTPLEHTDGVWTNAANPSRPFGSPSFDQAVYVLYPDEASAVAALKQGKVNGILEQGGLSPSIARGNMTGAQLSMNASSSVRFAVINPARPALADPVLRRALFCAVDRLRLAAQLPAAPQLGWLPGSDTGAGPLAGIACGEGYDASKAFEPTRSVDMLKAAGYSWSAEPTGTQAGTGLTTPHSDAIPPVVLLAPREQIDPRGAQAAEFVKEAAEYLGIPMEVRPVDPAEIRFALLNDHEYDMVIAGWHLSTYPGYLCDWFGGENAFGSTNPQIAADCQQLAGTSDLAAAQNLFSDIQVRLAEDPAFIPLYSVVVYDAYQGIRYPFDHVTNGLGGLYGAPSLALPAVP